MPSIAYISIAALAALCAFAAPDCGARAQNPSNCSRLIAPNGTVTLICPPASAEGGRWRGGEFIPACPPGMAFSRDRHQCLPAQNIGGVIPCSADDTTYITGRGWVSNCR
jgi:hypothetical protein